MSLSTITLQNVYDAIVVFGDIEPALNASGYSMQPLLTIATDVMNEICAQNFPQKWNEFNLPLFWTNQLQQDYAIPGLTNLSSLERGICIDINNPNGGQKPWGYVECGRAQSQSTAASLSPYFRNPLFTVNWLPNSLLYYGTWGAANTGTASLGNNPQANQTFTFPLDGASNTSITQIRDANGNYLVLTTYGTTGSSAPSLPANSIPGTTVGDGTCVWTVVDPQGQGFRINPVPGPQTQIWQMQLVGQMIPPKFTSFSQTLAPLTDEYEPNFRAGCIAQAYRYSPDA